MSDIDDFIRKNGVTKCPTAILAPTTATITESDAKATAHQRGLFKSQKRKAAYKYFYGDRSKSR